MVVMFMAMSALVIGATRLWFWSDAQIIGRQKAYEDTRSTMTWPVYGPKNITDDWVFKGDPDPGEFASFQGIGPAPYSVASNPLDYLEYLGEQVHLFYALSLDQVSATLDDLNQAIADVNANIPALTSLRDMWESNFNYADGEEVTAQQKIQDLEVQLADAKIYKGDLKQIGTDENGQPIYESYPQKVTRLNEEISMATNGYYTEEVCYGGDVVYCYKTYDTSGQKWLRYFSTRNDWANDFWILDDYKSSPGNDMYRLYNDYTAGLLDWQARKSIAQEQRDNYQSSLDQANSFLTQAQEMKTKLEEVKDSKS